MDDSKLKQLRIIRGMTQKELAEKAGLSIGMLSQMEHGARKLTLPSFDSLLEALGITYEEYFSQYSAEETEAIQKVMQILHSPNVHLRSYFAIVIEGLLLIHQKMQDEPNSSESFIKFNTEFISSLINSYAHSTKKSS